jgi:mRNA interferase MazF
MIGQIHWVELPNTGGREQAGRRPGTAPIKADKTSGLRMNSVALVFQLRAIDRGRIKEKNGVVSELEVANIRSEIARLLGENQLPTRRSQ